MRTGGNALEAKLPAPQVPESTPYRVKRLRALVIHISMALLPSLPLRHGGSLKETSADRRRALWYAFTLLQPQQDFLKTRIQEIRKSLEHG